MKQIDFKDPYSRKVTYEIDIDQLQSITNLHLNKDTSMNIVNNVNQDIITVLKKKYSSYKNQDKQSHKFDPEQHITYEQMIEKIYESKLKCYYCNCDLSILYNKKRLKSQWTLERLDNNLGHYNTNTCISCLECNLRRRTDNYEYFKQSKQTKVVKI
jgi:DNA repair exonuclease SbcCD ATPase subunit